MRDSAKFEKLTLQDLEKHRHEKWLTHRIYARLQKLTDDFLHNTVVAHVKILKTRENGRKFEHNERTGEEHATTS